MDVNLPIFEGTLVRNSLKGEFGREYSVWKGIHYRCYNNKSTGYSYYGGRGIKVSLEWHNFYTFLVDMGRRPVGTELDRIDNQGNYCKENCRWVTRKENLNNTRANVMITYMGKTQSASMWATELDIDPHLIQRRIKRGWQGIDAITYPVSNKGGWGVGGARWRKRNLEQKGC